MKTTVQDLHKQYNQFEDKLKLYLVHQFDTKTKSWKFSGYQCVHCGSNMKYVSSIDKHPSLCKELNKTTKRSYNTDEYEKVLTVDGNEWSPVYKQYGQRSS
jgi:hypothetical protein